MKLILHDIEAELEQRLADIDDGHLIVDFAELEIQPDVVVPAIRVTVTCPSPLVGQRLMHTDMLNPLEPINDELITKVCISVRMAFAQQRARLLAAP